MQKENPNYYLLLGLFSFVLSIAWLIPNHNQPWTTFHSDFWAALVLGCCALVYVLIGRSATPVRLDALSLATLGLLAVCVLQFAAGKISSFGVFWVSALYLLGLLLAIVVGRWWGEAHPRQVLGFLFGAAAVGALLSLPLQIYQLLDQEFLTIWARSGMQSRYQANLGQPNQLGSLLLLGVVGLGWAWSRKLLPAALALLLAAGLLFGLALTESRTGWLNVLLIGCAVLYWRRIPAIKKLALAFALLVVFYVLCVLAVPQLNAWAHGADGVREVRSLADSGRLNIWHVLLKACTLQPWTGYGWGQLRHAQFSWDLIPIDQVKGTIGHAHNLVLDLMLWNGIPIGLAFTAVLAWWWWKVAARVKTADQWFMLAFLVVLFTHGMLEFPLQYAYFLLPAGMMMGALSASVELPFQIKLPKWSIFPALLLALAAVMVTARDFLIIENSPVLLMEFKELEGDKPDVYVPDMWVLTHLRDNIVLAQKNPVKFNSPADIEWAEYVVRTTFGANSMFQLAVMHAYAGDADAAHFWQHFACRATGDSGCEKYREKWEKLAPKYPPMAKAGWKLAG